MTALFPFIAVLILTALAPSSLLDLLGVTSPWATPLIAAGASALLCRSPSSAAGCAVSAVLTLEGLLWMQGQSEALQAAAHLATAGLLGAVFALTQGSQADNSATSQAQGVSRAASDDEE